MNQESLRADIEKTLREQMRFFRPIGKKRPIMEKPIDEMLDNFRFTHEPYLESIPYYAQDKTTTLETLCNEGDISPHTADAFAAYFGCAEREKASLYEHQVAAIREVRSGNNLVVCTGTGSGKTESFLLPLIDSIVREREACSKAGQKYTKGVRALILYPMNALVNDQLRRIRAIVNAARRNNIPFARDITYGRFTGDVETEQQERRNQAKLLPLDEKRQEFIRELAQETNTAAAEHPYFSEDEVPRSQEYTKRLQWREGPADILITNYVMLERMLLNPEYEHMFSSTWKFIILDESHTYDGALGTDVAWLMRRLSLRVHPNDKHAGDSLTYMATSATLVEEGSEEQKKNWIKQQFAAKLFPAPASTFSVQLGSLYSHPWKTEKVTAEKPYTRITGYKSEAMRRRIDEACEAEDSILRCIQPSPEDASGLIQQTRWVQDAHKWLNSLSYLEAYAQRGEGKRDVAFGDAVELARLCSLVDGERKLCLSKEGAWTRLRFFADRDNWKQATNCPFESCWNAAVRLVCGACSKSQMEAIRADIINAFFSGTELQARYFSALPLAADKLMQACLQENEWEQMFTDAREGMAAWPLCWDETSDNLLRQYGQQITTARAAVDELSKSLLNEWKELTGIHTPDDTGLILAAYLEQYHHTGMLAEALAAPQHEDKTRGKLIARLFGEGTDRQAAAEEFDALTQLLTLTRHPRLRGKSLLDLRYHLAVNSIGSVALSFDEQMSPILKANDYRAVDDAGNAAFTLGVCYECAAPFILAYAAPAQINDSCSFPIRLARYKTQETPTRFALSWLSAEQEVQEDDDTPPPLAPLAYLDIATGQLHNKPQEDKSLPIYRISAFDEDEAIQCPVCLTPTHKTAPISDYKTGATLTRHVLLSAIIAHADGELLPSSRTTAGGRKLLAFSDSRQGAARLASEYDIFTHDLLVGSCIYHWLESGQNDREKFIEYFSKEGRWVMPQMLSFEKWKETDPGIQRLKHMFSLSEEQLRQAYDNVRESFVPSGLDCSLKMLIPYLSEFLQQEKATALLNRDYRVEGQETESYPEDASVAMTALATLRKTNRSSLIRSGCIRVRSAAYEQVKCAEDAQHGKYRNFMLHFPGSTDAERSKRADLFFAELYTYLFRKAKLSFEFFGTHPECYTKEISYAPDGQRDNDELTPPQAINAYSIYPTAFRLVELQAGDAQEDGIKLWSTRPNAAVHSLLMRMEPEMTEFESEECLADLAELLKHTRIITKKRLNADDVRFACGSIKPLDFRLYARIEEHTAQLSNVMGQIFQREFMEGRINILSCSTTFEMGVDLGDLNCVFMANMPPSTANYRQRAGRAGRRAGSTSCVVTYLGDSAHDSYYSSAPHELFFGRIVQPQLYLENRSFRAKHMRAEALHSYLSFRQRCNTGQAARWNKNADFFASAGLASIEQWYTESHSSLQKHCEKLLPEHETLEYDVALDLIYQSFEGKEFTLSESLRSRMAEQPFALSNQFRAYAGPNHPTGQGYWDSSALVRYSSESTSAHVRNEQIYTSLPNWGVIPRYGFPCNIIQLKPMGDTGLRLQRDARLGLFDYMQGRQVVAGKFVYESLGVLFLKADGVTAEQAHKRNIFLCDTCGYSRMTKTGENKNSRVECPRCGASRLQYLHCCIPDAFQANRGKKQRTTFHNDYTQPIVTCSETGEEGTSESFALCPHLSSRTSDTGELFYLNKTACNRYIPRDEENSAGEHFHGALHIVHTEIVIWELSGGPAVLMGAERMNAACYSALQAIIRAAAIVLGIKEGDIGGITNRLSPDRHQFVLYDESANGAGSIMKLFMTSGQDATLNHAAKQLSLNILNTALRLCDGRLSGCRCHCGDEDAVKRPIDELQYRQELVKALQQGESEADVRPRTSCYKCLRSYRNQRAQGLLDATDAATLLRYMLGTELLGGHTKLPPLLPVTLDTDTCLALKRQSVALQTRFRIRYRGEEREAALERYLAPGRQPGLRYLFTLSEDEDAIITLDDILQKL